MAEEAQPHQSWWQTVPGILTGIAAVITAVTGLVVAFNRTDGRPREQATPPTRSVPAAPATGPAATPPSSNLAQPAAQSIALPTPNPLRLSGGDAVIAILSAQTEPIDADRRLLKLHLRYTNTSRYPANFWSASYRLLVADVPRAPTNLLDEVVDGDSAKEGDVMFEVPVTEKNVVLQVSAGDDKSRLPLKLP